MLETLAYVEYLVNKMAKKKAAHRNQPISEHEAKSAALLRQLAELEEETKFELNQHRVFEDERERLEFLWHLDREALEKEKEEVAAAAGQLEDLREKHFIDLRLEKQRVKQTKFANMMEMAAFQMEAEEQAFIQSQNAYDANLPLQKSLLEVEEVEGVTDRIKLSQKSAVRLLHERFLNEADRQNAKHKHQIGHLREQIDTARQTNLAHIEELKDKHIAKLQGLHQNEFAAMKKYYSELTHALFSKIKILKERRNELQKTENFNMRVIEDLSAKNVKITEPMRLTEETVENLVSQKSEDLSTRSQLVQLKATLKRNKTKLAEFEFIDEILTQRLDAAEQERDELSHKLRSSVYRIKQKTGLKTMIAEKKLALVQEETAQS